MLEKTGGKTYGMTIGSASITLFRGLIGTGSQAAVVFNVYRRSLLRMRYDDIIWLMFWSVINLCGMCSISVLPVFTREKQIECHQILELPLLRFVINETAFLGNRFEERNNGLVVRMLLIQV